MSSGFSTLSIAFFCGRKDQTLLMEETEGKIFIPTPKNTPVLFFDLRQNSNIESISCNPRNIEAHYFFYYLDEPFFCKVVLTKTAKYSSSLNNISKKKKRYLKNSKRVSKGKNGTFRFRNEFRKKNLIRDVI